jgi:soluble lytic murein transglycosylase
LRSVSARLRLHGLLLALIAAAAIAATDAPPEGGSGAAFLRADGEAGPMLRRAVAALEAGDSDAAEALLRAVAERHPLVADHADLLRMRLYLRDRRFGDAVAMRGTWEHTESPLEAAFLALLGDAYAASGDEIAARSAWEFARLETDDDERLAALHLASARSYERSGERATAAESYLHIWTAYPLSDEAELAAERLDGLERKLGRRVRTGLAWRQRGDVLFRSHRNEGALEAYEKALASGELSAAQEERARSQRADTLFRLRRYTEAANAYDALPPDPETEIAYARSLVRSGRMEQGIRELERVADESRGDPAARAGLLAAILLEDEDEPDRARRRYEEVLRREPRSEHAKTALWQMGWTAYRKGRFTDARVYFEALEKREAPGIESLRARYWGARAGEREGYADGAPVFAAMAREYPLTYYGWRARTRAGADAGPEVEPPRLRPGTAALEGQALERPRILLEAGLVSEARDELDRLFARARGLDDRLALAELYSNAGDFHRPQRLVVDAYVEELGRGPAPAQLELWWHAWPAPFAGELERALVGLDGLEPELVYSIMREESGYRPEVVSISGARGLLQLMPSTAERLATQVRLDPFSADDLFDPGVNIRLGATYLQQLLDRFDGRRSAAIGSYNAGPDPVARWLAAADTEDDEWVESIGYDQTRTYVKRVLRSLHVYRVLY